MPPRSEVLGDGTIGGEEALGVARRLEALHPPLPLAGGLVGVLGAVVEIAVLAVLHTRQELVLRRPIACEFVGDDHPRHVGQPFSSLRKNFFAAFLFRRLCTRISSTWPS